MAAWDGESGRLLHRFEHAGQVRSVALSPDGRLLAAGDTRGAIAVWSLDTGRGVVRLPAVNVAVHALAFGRDPRRRIADASTDDSASGWLLAAGDAGGAVTVWDLTLQVPRSYCRGSLYDIYAVAFSPDGMTLASTGRQQVRLWDVATGRLLCVLGGGADYVYGLAFSPDGRRLATAGWPRYAGQLGAVLWELETGAGVQTLRGLSASGVKVAFSPDAKLLAAVGHNWQVAIWNREEERLLHMLEVPPGRSVDNAALAFDHAGRLFASSAGDRATLWDLSTGELEKMWPLPPGLGDRLVFDTAADRLLSFRFEEDNQDSGPIPAEPGRRRPLVCRLRNLFADDHDRALWEIRDFARAIHSLAASADGRFLVIDGVQRHADRNRHVVAAYLGANGRRLWSLPLRGESPGVPRIDPNGSIVVIWDGADAKRYLVDLSTGTRRITDVPILCPGPLGAFHASAEPVGIGLHQIGGSERRVTLGIDHEFYCLESAFSRDGRFLAWTNRDGTALVADIPEIQRRLARLSLGW